MLAGEMSLRFEQTYVRPRQGRTLIVGSKVYKYREDRRKRYEDAVGVDMESGTGVDVVLDLELHPPLSLGTFNHVECISVLEHSKRPWLMAENIQRLMNPRATIHLSVPFIWGLHSYPSDYWRLTAQAVEFIFPQIRWDPLLHVHMEMVEPGKVPAKIINDHRYLARTEVHGFGVKERP